MIVSEEAAKLHICPVMSSKRIPEGASPDCIACCQGRECMMWRPVSKSEGYCGLTGDAGKVRDIRPARSRV